ncbi:hypothetical protein QO179_24465 [Bacillus stercoris]|nr:hypothetical protein [Bacillus stercoris]
MLGIESLLMKLFEGNSLMVMLSGFVLLVLLNLIVKLILEIKKKNLNWDDLPEFIKPIMLYGAFLIGSDLLVASAQGIPSAHDLFQGVQIIGYVAIMAKYFKVFYNNLKDLGMPVDERIDEALEEKLDSSSGDIKDQVVEAVERYLANRESTKEDNNE